MLDEAVRSKLEDVIKKHRVVLFMKGNKHFPQCGFSAQVVQILKEVGTPFETVNVLQDPAVRDGIKEYSSWPTIPQLYVDGEFIGGCDIVKELYASGELQQKLGVPAAPPEPVAPPTITVEEGAAKAIRDADEGTGEMLRLEIGPRFQYELYFDKKKAGDVQVESNGISILFDRDSAQRANGIRIAWVETADGGAFKIDNPNEPPRVKPLSPKELKAWIDDGKKFELFDVRGEDERRAAKIAQAKMLDAETERYLASLDKETPIVLHCHHGMRSRNAAERLVREGFKNVFNLEGGIDAWSQTVDPNVPRYG